MADTRSVVTQEVGALFVFVQVARVSMTAVGAEFYPQERLGEVGL